MKILGEYSGYKIPFFEEFDIDLSYEGVTVIRGLNLNVKDMADRNNGSGKTLLLSGIAEILIGSNPTIERNELIARKALFPNSDSQLALEIDDTLITKGRFGGASVAYGVQANGGGLEKVKKEVAQQYLAENIGYNEDSFYTLVYLDGGKDFPLIVGTSVQRVQFLSNIFATIESFEHLHDYFYKKTREFGQKANTFYALEEELSNLGFGESDESRTCEYTQADLDKLAETLANKKSDLQMVRNQLSNTEMASTYLKLISNIESISKKLGIERDNAQIEFGREGKRRDEARKYKTLKHDVEVMKDDLAEIRQKIDKLEMSDLDDSKYDLLENADEYADTYREWAADIKKILNSALSEMSLPFRINSPQTVDDLLDLSNILDFLFSCLLPSGDIIGKQSSKSPYKIAAAMENSARMKMTAELGNARKNLESLIRKKISIANLGESFSEKAASKIRKAHKNVLDLYVLKEEEKELDSEYSKLRKKLSNIERPTPRPLAEYDLLGEMVRDIRTLESLGMKNITEDLSDSDLASLKAKVDTLSKEILELTEQHTTMKAEIEFYEENVSVISNMEDRLEGLKKYPKAQRIADTLKRAFSNKGIRVMLLNQLTAQLANRMNKFSHLVFPEPMSFRFDLTEKSCDIIVTRNSGTKHEVESDIRVLSQGERKSFSLLLLYSMLPLIPQANRLNIVVLDEMTANMDGPTKLKIFRDFIPALRDVVPHIVLADTGNLEIDDAREYTIIKKKNVSRLVENSDVQNAIRTD